MSRYVASNVKQITSLIANIRAKMFFQVYRRSCHHTIVCRQQNSTEINDFRQRSVLHWWLGMCFRCTNLRRYGWTCTCEPSAGGSLKQIKPCHSMSQCRLLHVDSCTWQVHLVNRDMAVGGLRVCMDIEMTS